MGWKRRSMINSDSSYIDTRSQILVPTFQSGYSHRSAVSIAGKIAAIIEEKKNVNDANNKRQQQQQQEQQQQQQQQSDDGWKWTGIDQRIEWLNFNEWREDEDFPARRISSLRRDEWNTFNVLAVVTPRRRGKVKHFHSQQIGTNQATTPEKKRNKE